MNINELIQTITQSTELPLLTAFVLGALLSVNPCQIAINVSAFSYLLRNGNSTEKTFLGKMREPMMYILGRSTTYILLAYVLVCLIGGGTNISGIQNMLAMGERILPYALLIIGCCMIVRTFMHHHHDDDCHNCRQIIRRNGSLGAFILGTVLAFTFCPESAVFYFGVMIPLSVTSNVGIAVPIVFSIAANLLNIGIAVMVLLAFSKVERFTELVEKAQMVINVLVGIIFIAMAVLLLMG